VILSSAIYFCNNNEVRKSSDIHQSVRLKNSSGSVHSHLFSMMHRKQLGLFGPFCVHEMLLTVPFFYRQQLIFMKLNICSH